MGAHLTSLVRTRSGRFSTAQAVTLNELAGLAAAGRVEQALNSIDDALTEFPAVLIDEAESIRVKRGNQISCTASLVKSGSDRVRLHDKVGRLLAIARVDAAVLKPELVFS
jgi:tRNA pseudouridine55 synthase